MKAVGVLQFKNVFALIMHEKKTSGKNNENAIESAFFAFIR